MIVFKLTILCWLHR